MESDGSGNVKGNRLKSARAAETDAAAKLRSRLESLPLTPNTTLGHAAAQDARLAAALTRGLTHARMQKTEYQRDGTANVRLLLDLSDVWQEIEHAF